MHSSLFVNLSLHAYPQSSLSALFFFPSILDWARAAFVPEYSEGEAEVTVTADSDGGLTYSYPAYEDGWTVTAAPDGTLTDTNGQLYSYLYWEGTPKESPAFRRASAPAVATLASFWRKLCQLWG